MNLSRKFMKYFTYALTLLVGLIVVLLGLVYILPGYDAYIVRSDSMKPVFQAGDVIISVPPNSPLGSPIEVGSIVTYQSTDGIVTHRVISHDFYTVQTKGDASNTADTISVAISDIKGVQVLAIPKLGYAVNFLRTKNGWFLCILLPASLLIVWIIVEILKETFKQEEIAETVKSNKRLN